MKTLLLSLALLASLVGSLYCFFALLMVGSFEASGHYTMERFRFNNSLWTTATLLFLFAASVLGFLLTKKFVNRVKNYRLR
jgi:hypothetical protein